MSLLPDGTVLLGLSNPGMLVQMGSGYATKGTLTSDALDAVQVARFGKLQLDGTLPARTAVTVASRSGNTADPRRRLAGPPGRQKRPPPEFLPISSPPARFLQYRLTLSTQDPGSTPTIEQVKVNYAIPNIAPKVASVVLEPIKNDADTEKTTPPLSSPASYTIKWETSDPNNDRLVYTLHYRLGHLGPWILLKDKLTETSFTWETRKMADGRYQVRVTASG